MTCFIPDWQYDVDTRVLWCANCAWCVTFESLELFAGMWVNE